MLRFRRRVSYLSPLAGEGGSHRRCEPGEGSLSLPMWQPLIRPRFCEGTFSRRGEKEEAHLAIRAFNPI
jgi:hypothetical protein